MRLGPRAFLRKRSSESASAVLAGFLGARLYEVLFNWDYYGPHPGKIVAVWEGGLAIHGGLIAGPVVGITLAWRWRLPILQSLDVAATSLALGQAIGRSGNFFNEEAFGSPTAFPWRLYVSPGQRPAGYEAFEYFHPTFLYESVWNLGVFLALVLWLQHSVFLVPRTVLDRPRAHRAAAAGQFLAGGIPGSPSLRARRAWWWLPPDSCGSPGGEAGGPIDRPRWGSLEWPSWSWSARRRHVVAPLGTC